MTGAPTSNSPHVAVVGAGLTGALMATYLGRAGHEVDVYEHRADPRTGHASGGRSINLAISARGIRALTELGLEERIMKNAIPMRGRMIHSPEGNLSFLPYDKDPRKCINSISRAGLNLALIQAADEFANVRLHFGHHCVGVELERPAMHFRTNRPADSGNSKAADGGAEATTDQHETVEKGINQPHGSQCLTIESDVVIGADGAFSAVRRSMQRLDRFDYAQSFLAHGYKELSIPPTNGGDFAMEPNALHIWPRRSFMMIALPNVDRTFTCTLFLAFDGPVSFAALHDENSVARFFHQNFPDAVPLMPSLHEDFRNNPTGSLATMRCGPWHYGGRVLLIGDAAHAIVPFYGQGMNAGFEDCTMLNGILKRGVPDWEQTFREFYTTRKKNADAIADLALHNFVEMRDHSASRLFHLKKAAERALHRFVPGYVPLYSMISFSCIPYAEALRRAQRKNRLLAALTVVAAFALILALGVAP